MNKIGVINYGMSNIMSIVNALEKCQIPYDLINHFDRSHKDNYLGFILPGVGSFGSAMRIVRGSYLEDYLNFNIVELKKPILGICLGMQMLFEGSEESKSEKGLNFLPGFITKFPELDLKVPHVGWNNVIHDNQGLFKNIKDSQNFYFDHSYFLIYKPREFNAIAKSFYGVDFLSSIQLNNIYGVQFHPEKSQIEGLKIFSNFAKICGLYFA